MHVTFFEHIRSALDAGFKIRMATSDFCRTSAVIDADSEEIFGYAYYSLDILAQNFNYFNYFC